MSGLYEHCEDTHICLWAWPTRETRACVVRVRGGRFGDVNTGSVDCRERERRQSLTEELAGLTNLFANEQRVVNGTVWFNQSIPPIIPVLACRLIGYYL